MSYDNILTTEQIIQSENNFILSNPQKNIMDVASFFLWKKLSKKINSKSILFICGPGNNGLDGIKIFNIAKKLNKKVELLRVGKKNIKLEKLKLTLHNCDIVIDCIFGIGLNRNISGIFKKVVNEINNSKKYIISIDIPSGINGDTGKVKGLSVVANETMVMGFFKPAHFLLPGKELSGKLSLVKIGLKLPKKRVPRIKHISDEYVSKIMPKHSLNIHKYKKGSVIVYGGIMSGASRLVALASRKIGAGLSTIEIKKKYINFYKYIEPGTILSIKKNNIINYSSLVVGPGLGKNYSKKNILKILDNKIPAVIDADAISIFEKSKRKFFKLLNIRRNSILTPHLGEFKKIFNFNEEDKLSSCLNASKAVSSIVILKGNDTIISCPNGNIWINSNAKNSLATAGSGDILSGLISGLLAQKLSMEKASLASVWFHGKLSHNKNNVIVEDFLKSIPKVLNTLNNN